MDSRKHAADPASAVPPAAPAVVEQGHGLLLLVDDEPNILTSLTRVFRPLGYRILTAAGGREGLATLEREAVDVVISDMRMPEMTGAEFLQAVAHRWPQTMRILLTGYSDLHLTVDAINKGHIYKYIGKPWDDIDIKVTVRRALERKRLEEERDELLRTIQRQNAELMDLNTGLEAKVQARVSEIGQMMGMIEKAHEELKSNFVDTLGVLSSIIEAREGSVAGHSRRVAALAQRLALEVGLREHEAQTIHFAALLQDIGEVALPDPLVGRPFAAMTREEQDEVIRHPAVGEALLMSLHSMQDVSNLIRSHHELYDGSGFPDGLRGNGIPLGARILAVVNDHDLLRSGKLLMDRLDEKQAQSYLHDHKGSRYDPEVVDAFIALLRKAPETLEYEEAEIGPDELHPGMRLTRDLLTKSGMILLPKGKVIDQTMALKIRAVARSGAGGGEMKIWVVRG